MKLFCLVMITLALSISTASSDDFGSIIEEFRDGKLPLKSAAEASALLPFATEWDAISSGGKPTHAEAYNQLVNVNTDWMNEAVKALVDNPEAVKFFTSDEANKAFVSTYEKARKSGSSVGYVPYDQAKRFWLMSRTITAGPELIGRYPSGPSVQWCLPPFIRCGPPSKTD